MTGVSGARPPSRRAIRIAVRVGIAIACLLPVMALFGEALVRLCLPAYRAVFDQVVPELRLIELTVDLEGADRVVRAEVTLDRVVVLGNRVFSPDIRGRAYASTLAMNAIQGPMVAILATVAWPARRRTQIVWRLLLVVPIAGSAMLVDAPCVLAAELWKILLDAAATDRWSALVAWNNFLQGGGRHALGIAIGAAGASMVSGGPLAADTRPDAGGAAGKDRIRRIR